MRELGRVADHVGTKREEKCIEHYSSACGACCYGHGGWGVLFALLSLNG
ncbi:hypothetical protein NC651_011170 [Populus alba x Populus x berolinensis]|nr:hypothetical protein NC651_011170 [Populus alba x Populus x berolinensis]